jgi:hypothetical protein
MLGGAFEALSWVSMVIEDWEGVNARKALKEIKREVEEKLNDIKRGVAIHFGTRIQTYTRY